MAFDLVVIRATVAIALCDPAPPSPTIEQRRCGALADDPCALERELWPMTARLRAQRRAHCEIFARFIGEYLLKDQQRGRPNSGFSPME
jgi:hypothetical protein